MGGPREVPSARPMPCLGDDAQHSPRMALNALPALLQQGGWQAHLGNVIEMNGKHWPGKQEFILSPSSTGHSGKAHKEIVRANCECSWHMIMAELVFIHGPW